MVLADDHTIVRAGIRKILAKYPDIVVIGEACNGEEALERVKELSPDVLLLDVEMPVMNGFQVAKRLREAGSPVRVLVLSAHNDRHHIQGMLEGGVSGYLVKEEVPQILVDAVRGVARGERGWVSKRVAEKIA